MQVTIERQDAVFGKLMTVLRTLRGGDTGAANELRGSQFRGL